MKSQPKRVFPLHLSPFETFMLTDDRDRYPMSFVIEMNFEGRFDRTALEEALRAACDRHPLLKSRLERRKQGRLCWVPQDEELPAIDWQADDQPIELPLGERIDINRELGLRIFVRESDSHSQLDLQFHHACCDGIGAHRFIGDLLAEYGIRTAEQDSERPTLAPLDPGLLKTRAAQGVLMKQVRTDPQALREVFGYAWSILRRTATPLAARSRLQPGQRKYFGIYFQSLDRQDAKRLREAAAKFGIAVNDLLIAELLHCCWRWNEDHRRFALKKWFRVLMPTDQRGRGDEAMPAANKVAYSWVGAGRRVCSDRRRLARMVREQTALIKVHDEGDRFMDTLARACNVKGLLPAVLAGERCLATAVLTNLGDPTRRWTARFPKRDGRLLAGNVLIDDISGAPPLRAKTFASLSVSNYQRKVTIGVRCHPRRFSHDDTREFLRRYVEGLHWWLENA